MHSASKKWLICLVLCLVWLSLSGFTGLEENTTAGIGMVMDELTGEDIEEFKILQDWGDKVLANVEDYVSVRAEADTEAKVVGRLFKGCGGDVLEYAEGWTKIRSGEVEGYVSNDYLHFGADAYEKAQEEQTRTATALTGGLRVRSEANAEAKILKTLEEGEKLKVAAPEDGAEENPDWICVQYAEGKTGYVSAEYVKLQYELGKAMTMEAIRAKEAEEKKEKLKKQREAIKANTSEVVLLAALIQAEGGNQPYEGQVAIGAVVMNRVRSGGGTIADVIYAPGQFTVVNNGALARYIGGPKASCMQAAQEAINGYSNVGDYKHFRRAGADVGGIVIGDHVFY